MQRRYQKIIEESPAPNIDQSIIDAFYDSNSGLHIGEFFLMIGGRLYCYIPGTISNNDDLTVYVNGVFVDFRCSGGTDIDFTGLLAYDVDAKDKVQVMGIKL